MSACFGYLYSRHAWNTCFVCFSVTLDALILTVCYSWHGFLLNFYENQLKPQPCSGFWIRKPILTITNDLRIKTRAHTHTGAQRGQRFASEKRSFPSPDFRRSDRGVWFPGLSSCQQAKDSTSTLYLFFSLSLLVWSKEDWHGELVNQWTDRTHRVVKAAGFVCPIGNYTAPWPTHGPYGHYNLRASARVNAVNLIPIVVYFLTNSCSLYNKPSTIISAC